MDVIKQTLDLINRQKAEVERLTTMHSEMRIGMKRLKTEARKEFADRLWIEAVKILDTDTLFWIKEIKNNLLKEMEGEGNV